MKNSENPEKPEFYIAAIHKKMAEITATADKIAEHLSSGMKIPAEKEAFNKLMQEAVSKMLEALKLIQHLFTTFPGQLHPVDLADMIEKESIITTCIETFGSKYAPDKAPS